MSTTVDRGITEYSRREPGEAGNHNYTSRFDVSAGFVGITQFEDDGNVSSARVLLSPRQFRALVAFVNGARRQRRRTLDG